MNSNTYILAQPMAVIFAHGYCVLMLLMGCNSVGPSQPSSVNPFTDLAPIELNGEAQPVTSEIMSLGAFEAGQVIEIQVDGQAVESALLLLADPDEQGAGVVVGGGPSGQRVMHRIPTAGDYFAFVLLEDTTGAASEPASIQVELGDPDFRPPQRQVVQVLFEDGYLTDPGLFDPESGTPDDLAFLNGISATVQQGIVDQLKRIFEGTPVEIIDENDPEPDEPFSRLTFSPDRVISDRDDASDVVLILPGLEFPECEARVTYGEVLPGGARPDPGNSIRDDEAVVYVGSFQGRGENCRTAVVNSLNFVILALSQTGAHEIGHLVGLFHIGNIDIMNRATLAAQRELDFDRGQVEVVNGGRLEVLTSVIQDPDLYFESVFDVETGAQ